MRRTDQRRAAVFLCYQRDVTGAPIEELIVREPLSPDGPATGGPASDFTRELVEGVDRHRIEIDRLIAENAIDWSIDRIAPLERAILRVAVLEMLYRPEVPAEVAIDEAVETAKLYCGSDAPAFVNGILGGVMRQTGAVREKEGGGDG